MKYLTLISALVLSGCASSEISTKNFKEQLKETNEKRDADRRSLLEPIPFNAQTQKIHNSINHKK